MAVISSILLARATCLIRRPSKVLVLAAIQGTVGWFVCVPFTIVRCAVGIVPFRLPVWDLVFASIILNYCCSLEIDLYICYTRVSAVSNIGTYDLDNQRFPFSSPVALPIFLSGSKRGLPRAHNCLPVLLRDDHLVRVRTNSRVQTFRNVEVNVKVAAARWKFQYHVRAWNKSILCEIIQGDELHILNSRRRPHRSLVTRPPPKVPHFGRIETHRRSFHVPNSLISHVPISIGIFSVHALSIGSSRMLHS